MLTSLSPSQLDKWSADEMNRLSRYISNWESVRDSCINGGAAPILQFHNGLRLEYYKYDPLAFLYREIVVENCYSNSTFYSPANGDVVADIGANVGLFTLHMTQQAPGITVHCYEPSTDIRRRLHKNVSLNDGTWNVTIHAEAVTNTVGEQYLYDSQISGTRSIFRAPYGLEEGQTVKTTTLRGVCDRIGRAIDFLKIDTEGSEFDIIAAADEHCWKLIQRIALEYHEFIRPGIKRDVLSILAQNGFSKIIDAPSANYPNRMGVILATR